MIGTGSAKSRKEEWNVRFAAIDVGSNAVRLLVSNVYEVGEWQPVVRKADLYRVPVRLGEDAFVRGHIGPQKAEEFLHAMTAFSHLIAACGVDDTLACATSALRSADNGEELALRVRREAGIDLRIIDGGEEAEYIALNRLDGRFSAGAYLYIDVGGGSTELTLLEEGRRVASHSFNVGTVRLKEGLVSGERWEEIHSWLVEHTQGVGGLEGIGSGGNINSLFKMTRKAQDQPLTYGRLARMHQELSRLTMEERMIKLGMRPDRADVVVPAGSIYLAVMKWAGLKTIHVPQVGLADGMVRALYRKRLSHSLAAA